MKIDRIGVRRSLPSGARQWRRHAARLTAQEYIPFAAWILSWAAFASALGLTPAIWLMAANGFVQASRSLLLMQSFDAISARIGCARETKASARRLAFRLDGATLIGSLALLAILAIGFRAIGLIDLAAMMLIVALGLPARTPLLLALDRCNIGTAWRLGSSLVMLAGAGIVLLLGLHWVWAALAVGLREWGGLLGVWLEPQRSPAIASAPPAELKFAEIAARTSMAARRRLVYRIGKVALSAIGPVGSLIARTGRGGGLDGRLAARFPAGPAPLLVLAVLSIAAVALIILISRDPPALLIASVAARIAAAAFSALIWWPWQSGADIRCDWFNDDL